MTAGRMILHFTLGPVQGFIADARRTRDLWAGSFLLSWLSGQAMAALVTEAERCGRPADSVISFPDVLSDPMFLALRGEPGHAPYVGSLPNRFRADVTDIPAPGPLCRQAVQSAWNRLADRVFERFIRPGATEATSRIWRRQVAGFWDIAWVDDVIDPEGGQDDDGSWLDQRKNWRSHFATEPEPNDLCQQMGNLQEISGFSRVRSPKEQAAFWETLIRNAGISRLDLRPGERLCAIALIKRLFPLVAEEAIGWQPGQGAVDIVHWPSVSFIAAVPWLRQAQRLRNDHQSAYWHHADENLDVNFMGEAATRLFGLPANGLFRLDGHLLHEDGIRAWPADELVGGTADKRDRARQDLLAGLRDIQKHVGGPASEFYAVLIMDGDRIGAKIGSAPDQVKRGLGEFTERVRARFSAAEAGRNPFSGVLIYAGGDDVLALLPVDTAVDAACALREEYRQAFRAAGADPDAFTMSGAIVYAQYKVPLQAVLGRAHHYLDDVAKDRNGRDSLALAVMKPGGISVDWVSCWDGEAIGHLQRIIQNPGAYSRSLFHNLRERYAALFDTRDDPDREVDPAFADPQVMQAVLRAEYRRQGGGLSKQGPDQVEAAVASLMAVGRPLHRRSGTLQASDRFGFDGALLASFLSGEVMANRLRGAAR